MKLTKLLLMVKCCLAFLIWEVGASRAIADCSMSTLWVFWDTNTNELVTDNLDGCDDAFAITPLVNNYCYIGGRFGYAIGLKTDFSPNQNPVRAWSVCKVYVNPTTHAVTCYPMSFNASGSVYGVSGGIQTVNSIQVVDNGDVYVGGSFSTAGGLIYSSNIGCYTYSGGWQQTRIFTAFQPVNGFEWDSASKILTVHGASLSSVSGPTSSCNYTGGTITGLAGQALWHTYGGTFSCGYWTAP